MAGMRYRLEGSDELFTADELVRAGAESSDRYFQIFFSRTMRQASAKFHLEFDRLMEDPSVRLVLAEMFRGSAKTSRLRMHTARRVSYGMAKTCLYIGASESSASRSLRWLKRQVEFNKLWAGCFGLRPGSKWDQTEIEIVSDITGEVCWILGMGITGNVRGINFDDYRPDFIVLDDVITDENAATEEQRAKIDDLIHGAIKESLAPKVDEPNAKMVMAQTPMHIEDAVSQAKKSPEWKVVSASVWTEETQGLPVEEQVSAWPERLPTEEVRLAKNVAIATNKLSIWSREKEVRLITPESRAFRPHWLSAVDLMPTHTYNVLSIDPLPPPSDKEVKQGFKHKDFESLMVVGRHASGFYCKDYAYNHGHDPGWTRAKVFELCLLHNVMMIVVEGVAYQKTLKWILEDEMRRRQKWYAVSVVVDRRSKFHRITGALNGPGSNGRLFCGTAHTDLIQQFNDYPQVAHEDILESFAQGVQFLTNPVLEQGVDNYMKTLPDAVSNLRRIRVAGCP